MKVELLSYTKDAAELCATAANECYSDTAHTDIHSLSQKKIDRILDIVMDSGHHSTIEHASYTFSIIGISRACSHQLVRHRIASFSQQSQRYVKMDEPSYVTPASMDDRIAVDGTPEGDISRKELFEDAMLTCWCTYNALIESGVSEEDARYVLPNACTTNMIMTMNARELLHFLELRMCNKAQQEARDVANEIYKLCMKASPKIFKYAGPRCWTGKCIEKEPCGKPPKRMEL